MPNLHRLETQAISEQAIQWLRILRAAGPRERNDFWRWMVASPAHVRELLLAQTLEEELCGIDSARRIDVEALVAKAASDQDAHASRRLAGRDLMSWMVGIGAGLALIGMCTMYAHWADAEASRGASACFAARQEQPGLDDRIRVQRHALDLLFHQPARQLRMI
jgi:ferric-dicitrate binding protein FerR (iron transport regulator)